MNIATIAAAIPALRPLWARSAYQRQKNRGQVCGPKNSSPLDSTYIILDQQTKADPLPSCLETRITVQEGRDQGNDESQVESLPNCTGIMKTTDVSLESFRKVEGKWISENSSHSDRERSVEDVV